MFAHIIQEIDAMIARDPAARSRWEVFFLYPAFHAIMIYRLAHWLHLRRRTFFARWLSQLARWITGIEIHPGAVIGRAFFIDHGMGVVIGETAEIGDFVTLYHDVTLGGVSPAEASERQRSVKRHPTLEDGVIVGSGAQILGPITVRKNARVGANAVVLKDVAEATTVVGIPARAAAQKLGTGGADAFSPYGTPRDLTDPASRAIEGMMQHIARLEAQIRDLEERLPEGKAGDLAKGTARRSSPDP